MKAWGISWIFSLLLWIWVEIYWWLALNNPDLQACIGQIYPPKLDLKVTFKTCESTQGPIVYVSNYSWLSTFIVDTAQTCFPKLTGDARGLLVFWKQIAYPCAQGKCFSVLVCCMGSAVSLAGWHVKKEILIVGFEDSTLQSAFLTPKAVKFLQILWKVYIKHQIVMCQPSKCHEVVQEKSQLLRNLAQRHSSGASNCWFEYFGAVLNRSLFLSKFFRCCWTVTCLINYSFWILKK